MNGQRVSGLVVKELSQAYKDPSSIITALIFPLILLFLYGYGVSLDMNGIRIGVVAEDTGPLARGLIRSLTATQYMEVHTLTNRKDAEALLTSGKFHGIVVIPSYFSDYFINEDQTAPIQVIADGSQPNTAQFVQNYVRAIWFTWLQELALESKFKQAPLVTVVPRVWYNQQLYSVYFLIPGAIVIIITVTGALLTSLVIAREWERGTMEGLMSTPVTMQEIVVSKLIAYFILGIAAMLICFFAARYVYLVPFRGTYFALALSSLTYLSFALGMGLLISISIRDQFAASQVAIVSTYLPAFILSGFIFDISSMPVYLRVVTRFVPARYFVDNLKTIFLVGDVWSIILPNVLFIGAFSLVVFALIAKKCVKRLD
jgi:ABC-2 type transport system permease protein